MSHKIKIEILSIFEIDMLIFNTYECPLNCSFFMYILIRALELNWKNEKSKGEIIFRPFYLIFSVI